MDLPCHTVISKPSCLSAGFPLLPYRDITDTGVKLHTAPKGSRRRRRVDLTHRSIKTSSSRNQFHHEGGRYSSNPLPREEGRKEGGREHLAEFTTSATAPCPPISSNKYNTSIISEKNTATISSQRSKDHVSFPDAGTGTGRHCDR